MNERGVLSITFRNNHAYLQSFLSISVCDHQPPRRHAPVVQYLAHPNEHLLRLSIVLDELRDRTSGVRHDHRLALPDVERSRIIERHHGPVSHRALDRQRSASSASFPPSSRTVPVPQGQHSASS